MKKIKSVSLIAACGSNHGLSMLYLDPVESYHAKMPLKKGPAIPPCTPPGGGTDTIPVIGFTTSRANARSEGKGSNPEVQACRQRHNVHVLFLSSQPDDHVLNRLTSMLGRSVHKQGFCHVEICIPDRECQGEGYLSSSIYNGETVTLTKTKTFANPGYTVLTFTVDGAELSKIADYLFESKRLALKFDAVGMYLAALPFQVGWFRKWTCQWFHFIN